MVATRVLQGNLPEYCTVQTGTVLVHGWGSQGSAECPSFSVTLFSWICYVLCNGVRLGLLGISIRVRSGRVYIVTTYRAWCWVESWLSGSGTGGHLNEESVKECP